MGCSNIIPRTPFVSLSRLATIECPSERVSGESASDPCLPRFFRDGRYTDGCVVRAWCYLSMFCLPLRLRGA